MAHKMIRPPSNSAITLADKKKFLKNLKANGGNISAAAATVGTSYLTIRNHMEADPGFKEHIDQIRELAKHETEVEIHRRGVVGIDEDVWFHGKKVGTKKVYSDNLLMERARALMPEKYSKKSQLEINANVSVEDKAKEKLSTLLGIQLDEDSYDVVSNTAQ